MSIFCHFCFIFYFYFYKVISEELPDWQRRVQPCFETLKRGVFTLLEMINIAHFCLFTFDSNFSPSFDINKSNNLFLTPNTLAFLTKCDANKALASRCDPSQRHVYMWEKISLRELEGVQMVMAMKASRCFTTRVTGSHGSSHFIACYKITGGHTTLISHQTSRSHAISFIQQGKPMEVRWMIL